jgi:hypothetical protein
VRECVCEREREKEGERERGGEKEAFSKDKHQDERGQKRNEGTAELEWVEQGTQGLETEGEAAEAGADQHHLLHRQHCTTHRTTSNKQQEQQQIRTMNPKYIRETGEPIFFF